MSFFQKHKLLLAGFVTTLALSGILIALFIINENIKEFIAAHRIATVSSFTPAAYPIFDMTIVPPLSALSAVVLDNDSKVLLFAKNADTAFIPASTTKLMTAMVGLDYFSLRDLLTVRSTDVSGSVIGLRSGEIFHFEDLLYAMLLPSANDAALTISQNYPGGEAVFISKMNEKADAIYLTHTRFVDPIGLSDQNYTTAKDLSRLASIAIRNKTLAAIVTTKHRDITDLNLGYTYSLISLNRLLGLYGVNGVKTGYTDEAGQVLITSKIEKGHTIIIVVMKSEDRFADTQKILQAISNNITYLSMHP
ncbi:MAG TPA: serine hydrolase [Candidatus Saccharimonadales bacterium]|nr:serine hydrolase [Candidatus Saccharimonadales bacterium]